MRDPQKFQKQVLLILTIPLLLFLIYNVASEQYDKYIKNKNFTQNKNIKDAIRILKSNKVKIDDISIIKYIDKYSNKFNVMILDTKFSNKLVSVKLTGKYQDILNFILTIEENIQIKKLILLKSDKNIICHFEGKVIDIKENTILQYDNNIPNPFTDIKYRINSNNLNLALTAILGDEVCINNKWYKEGQTIKKYKIIKIYLDYVKLSSKDKVIEVRIQEDD